MDKSGGENDSSSEGLGHEEDVLVGTERRYPFAQDGNAYANASADQDRKYCRNLERQRLLLIAAFLVSRAVTVAASNERKEQNNEKDEAPNSSHLLSRL
ncbi:hypothetical protein MUK42_30073 [Musa troglodytarum]|uniref:Uncharacterized protein n=1 Tax=Musa troglodytarum TaxID=320322 RepID=A0A9E7FKC7_9LILI|nr:hypothetical protein MUK42_30073 [Musa troglodytarum]